MSILLDEFCTMLQDRNKHGDILEFGTAWGGSAQKIGSTLPHRRLFTYDGFVGLPKTSKPIPKDSEWWEGHYNVNESDTRNKLERYKNVIITKCMSWELKNPSEYGITKIVGANLDFDLYEGTVDALNFIELCEWNEIILRFDDWGGHPYNEKDVFEHEKAAFYEWIDKTNYKYVEHVDLLNRARGYQTIFTVNR